MSRTTVKQKLESPEYVRTSLAAAITMDIVPGQFYRDAMLYCINLLLTYDEGCAGRCAYCGLSKAREPTRDWSENSFIRVDWPTISLDEVLDRVGRSVCPYVERVCVSMITNIRSLEDTLTIVRRLSGVIDGVSVLITPTIASREWLQDVRAAGADKVGIAIDAATPDLFDKFRAKRVSGPHRWNKYWSTVEEAVKIFGRGNVGVHLIFGLGETERDIVRTIEKAQRLGAETHLFSFFPEEGSQMEDWPQPPIGGYARVQLARYLINEGLSSSVRMAFDEEGHLTDYGVDVEKLEQIIDDGTAFMTAGCSGKTRKYACNRPYANCTPYQASIGEMRNYPFKPEARDIDTIRRQLADYTGLDAEAE